MTITFDAHSGCMSTMRGHKRMDKHKRWGSQAPLDQALDLIISQHFPSHHKIPGDRADIVIDWLYMSEKL